MFILTTFIQACIGSPSQVSGVGIVWKGKLKNFEMGMGRGFYPGFANGCVPFYIFQSSLICEFRMWVFYCL